jgi:S-adenosylmethionine-dependent methyltransferase
MVDDIGDIAEFYNREAEGEDARLNRHQLEHDLTWRFFERYLPADGKILEIGAATGRYTVELARREYSITAVDLSVKEFDICRNRLIEKGLQDRVQLVISDARDLSLVEDSDYDAVLLMGPLYHVVVDTDRKQVLKQAYDRLKDGGLIFSAFISRFGILGHLLRNTPEWIEDQSEVHSVIEKGKDPDHQPEGGFRGYFARVDEIAPLHEEIGFETLTLAGIEPGISADDESYNQLTGSQRKLWLDLFENVSTEESILGASRHLIYVGRKNNCREGVEPLK